jgi:glycosyltransferase involved in cell wall biosynthesis
VFVFTAIIVTHGREELLSKCLDSLRPVINNWQLILLENGDALSAELRDKARLLTDHVVFLDVAAKMQPGKARNLAMGQALGEWIFFIDDDALVIPGYWDTVLPLLKEEKIDVLGGPDAPVSGMNPLGAALAIALSSPFCTGRTSARHKAQGIKLRPANDEMLTSCNLWVRRSALGTVSFPEDYLRGEETLFLQRLAAEHRGLFYHPRLRVGHHRRSKLAQLLRPTFYAGFYRSRLMKEGPGKGNGAFWLPAIFVLLHLILFLDVPTFLYLARMYVSIILFASVAAGIEAKRPGLIPLVAFLHYFVVFVYGLGFLFELTATRRRGDRSRTSV